MDKFKKVCEEIKTHGLVIGTLADEAIESAKDERFMAALSCLFILAEQSVKQANQVNVGNFHTEISVLEKSDMLSVEEVLILSELRNIRNAFFHENHYMYAVVANGIATMFSEHEAKKNLWDKLSLPVLNVCLKLITKHHIY